MAVPPKVKCGQAYKDSDGTLHGRVSGLGLGSVDFIGEDAVSHEGKPYYRLIADPAGDAYEIGAAFIKEKDGVPYYSVSLDSPFLPAPVNAALFQDKNAPGYYNMIWYRPQPEPKPAAEATAQNTGQSTSNAAAQQKRSLWRKGPAATP